MTHGPVVRMCSASARVKQILHIANAHGKRCEPTGTRENTALFLRTRHAHSGQVSAHDRSHLLCGTRAQRAVMDNLSPTIAHRVAQPLRTRVGTAFPLNGRPLRKHSVSGSHLTVQGLNTRFARDRRRLRKTLTPDE